MWSVRVVFFEPGSKPFSELIVVFWSPFHPKKELLFICSEGSFNESVFIGAMFVNAVVWKVEFFAQCIKSSLKLETVVGLDEHGFERESGEHQEESAHTPVLIQLIENDRLFVAGVDINDGVLVAGPRQAREFRRHVFDVHLQISNGMHILCMHMNRGLIPWPDMIPIPVDQSFSFEDPVNGRG